KLTLDSLTNEEKRTPFLFFQIVSATDQRGRGQYEGLTSPVRHQIKKARRDYKYIHRPEIIDVAFTSMDGLLSNEIDYSVAFGSGLEAYDTLYWNRSAREGEKDARHHVKGKNYYVKEILNVFQIAFRRMFKIHEEAGQGGEHIRYYLWARNKNKRFYFSFSKPTQKMWNKIYVRIPFISSSKYTKNENHFSLKGIAQRLPHILLSDDISGKREDIRRKASINFLLMVYLLRQHLPRNLKKDLIWNKLNKIANKYEINENLQILAKDWAKIIILLFPEIISSSKIIMGTKAELQKKKPLKSLNFEKIDCDNPDPKELIKLFPPETRIDWHVRTPYYALFSFLGYCLGSNWGIFYTKTNKQHQYPKDYYSQPDILIEQIYRLYVPWLIIRAKTIKKYLEEKTLVHSDINKLVIEEYLPADLIRILSFSYNEFIEKEKIEENEQAIILSDKLIWFFIRECQYMDTISFNLPESMCVMRHILELFDIYQDVQGVAENVNELFEGIQTKYFSF
ncbi:MAG: hypothetical protein ACXABJ_01950, partial [Candidatus Heimdallarchaeaceae archaeon]